ncbi:MAG: histidine--tRNA ligase [SAR86 cluster bacterium]|uniref:Histidine--tRNA ligase n=1 Tax=SAR86 cluster bacterium TaxID=2030880 RepID=A0A2A4MTN2_9GAMM|nr:MAG: histidine--tRNA ligase [SAR86 cluster bacterium]
MAKIQAIRGMNDILPDASLSWQYLEQRFAAVMHRYAYSEIRFPILEQTQLFKRSIGEVTDIVEKEMYSFDDRNGDNLSLRPEGTACCVRAADQHGLLYNQQQRLWYQGPMFRHERPQKGRYRQFHQFGVEAFGMAGPDIDAELILLSASLWHELGLQQHLQLEINNIGDSADRKLYAKALSEFLESKLESLDEDAKRRMYTNPMRVLDSKNPQVQQALQGAPELVDYVSQESQQQFEQFTQLLDIAGQKYIINPRLVRGLDYYNNAVFEWTTDILGAQSAVCGGGRYDGLVAQLGGKPTKAAGFAIGKERLVLMLDELDKIPQSARKPVDIYLMVVGDTSKQGLLLAEKIRHSYPQAGLISHCGGGKYKAQLKKAYSSGAKVALVLEHNNVSDNVEPNAELATVKLRKLDDTSESITLTIDEAIEQLAEYI